MNIGVTGISGKLGKALAKVEIEGVQVTPFLSNFLDCAKEDFPFPPNLPDMVIHTAALADVCKAEENPEFALYCNTQLPIQLAEKLIKNNVKMIFISTDHVFDGRKGYYKPIDTPNPKGVYATSKLAAELALIAMGQLVIRTSFISCFPLEKAFTDKYFSGDTVDIIAKLVTENAIRYSREKGIVHVGTGRKSIHDVAKRIRPNVGKMKLEDNPVNRVGLPYLKDTSFCLKETTLFC